MRLLSALLLDSLGIYCQISTSYAYVVIPGFISFIRYLLTSYSTVNSIILCPLLPPPLHTGKDLLGLCDNHIPSEPNSVLKLHILSYTKSFVVPGVNNLRTISIFNLIVFLVPVNIS